MSADLYDPYGESKALFLNDALTHSSSLSTKNSDADRVAQRMLLVLVVQRVDSVRTRSLEREKPCGGFEWIGDKGGLPSDTHIRLKASRRPSSIVAYQQANVVTFEPMQKCGEDALMSFRLPVQA